MFVDTNQYVNALCKLNITANQFLLCYLLYTDQKINGKYPNSKKGGTVANIYKYATANKGAIKWTTDEIDDLVEKGYLEFSSSSSKHQYYPDHYVVKESFEQAIFASKNRFQQLLEEYPTLIDNFNSPSGPKIKLKVCDIDEMEKIYNRKVRSKAQHEKILEVVRWAKENKQLNTSFANFIRGNLWQTYEQQMEEYEESDNMNIAR